MFKDGYQLEFGSENSINASSEEEDIYESDTNDDKKKPQKKKGGRGRNGSEDISDFELDDEDLMQDIRQNKLS